MGQKGTIHTLVCGCELELVNFARFPFIAEVLYE